MSKSREDSIRISFEDTLNNQETFRNRVEFLIRDKRSLRPNEINNFLKTFSKAMFTVGIVTEVKHRATDGTVLRLGHFHYFVEKLAYQTKTPVKISYKHKTYIIPIEELWKTVHNYLLILYPYAQRESVYRSAERFRLQAKPGSVEFTPSTRHYK